MLATWLLAVAVLVVGSGCGGEVEGGTRVDVRFHAEPASAMRAESLRLVVRDTEGDEVLRRDMAVSEERLPVGVRLVPQGGDAARRYRLEAELLAADGVPFNRIGVAGTYVEGELARLDLWFDDDCIDVACGVGQTCEEGRCVAACFTPSQGSDRERDRPTACPGAAPVWVDFATGADHPALCTDPATPCATIQYALDNYPLPGLGTVINVRGGQTYRESIEIRGDASGVEGAPTTLRPWDGARPVIDANGAETGIRLCCGNEAAHHVVVEGFEITGAAAHGVLLRGQGADFNVIRDCTIHDNGIGPSEAEEGSGITVDEGADRNRIEGNVVVDSGVGSAHPARGIVVDASVGVEVIGNVVTGSRSNGIRIEGGQAVTVRGNVVRTSGGNGLTFWGEDHVAEDNVFCDNYGQGIRLVDAARVRIEHNTILGSGDNGIALLSGAAATGVRSNILAFNGGFGVLVEGEEPLDSHNLYFDNAMGPVQGFVPDMPDTDVVGQDPLLADPAACEATPAAGSPALGAAHDGEDMGARAPPPSP